ncbi:MAG TPA: TraX family protein [Candidatus Paceibacterota bacterium]
MNSLQLKLLACLTMLIDHIGFLFFPEQIAWRIIGRLSFPLFAFLIAEGYSKTKDRNKYFGRLFLFGIISQIPYKYFHELGGYDFFSLNIFFTLALGVAALAAADKIKSLPLRISTNIIILVIAYVSGASYGIYGILTILASGLYLKSKDAGVASLTTIPVLEAARISLTGLNLIQAFAVFGIVPILFYNGNLGPRISRWWFYWFYPANMIILALIYLCI